MAYGDCEVWTAVTRTALKSDAGVVEQFNSVVEVCLRPTLVATVTKFQIFNIKLATKYKFKFKLLQVEVDLESLLSQVESILLTSVTPRSNLKPFLDYSAISWNLFITVYNS